MNKVRVSAAIHLRCRCFIETFLRAPASLKLRESDIIHSFPGNVPSDLLRFVSATQATRFSVLLQQRIAKPRLFADSIARYFPNAESDYFVFSNLTFPALYSYFTIPDFSVLAVEVISFLMDTPSPHLICPLVAAFFHYPGTFPDLLYGEYFRAITEVTRPQTPVYCFRILISALRIAVKKLTVRHFELAAKVAKKDITLFNQAFISDLLIPIFNARTVDSPVVAALHFAVRDPGSLSGEILREIFTEDCSGFTEELELLGGLNILDKTETLSCISICEYEIITEMLQIADPPDYRAGSRWAGLAVKLYPDKRLPKKGEAALMVKQGQYPVFNRLREAFDAKFVHLHNLDQLRFQPQNLVSSTSIVRIFHSKRFRKYFELKCHAERYESINLFHACLGWKQVTVHYQELLAATKTSIESFRRILAIRYRFQEPEFVFRRQVLELTCPPGKDLKRLAARLMKLVQQPQDLSAVETKFLAILAKAVNIGTIGERIFAFADVIAQMRQFFQNPYTFEQTLWKLTHGAIARQVFLIVPLFLRKFHQFDTNVTIKAELAEKFHAALAVIKKYILDKDEKLRDMFITFCFQYIGDSSQ